LLDIFKSIHCTLFFQLDEGGRGHDNKLFKRRFRLDIRKYVFGNRVIDNWNSLPTGCVNRKTIDTFKKHVSPVLESGDV